MRGYALVKRHAGEWEWQMDSRWAPPAKKELLSFVLGIRYERPGAGAGDFEDDVPR